MIPTLYTQFITKKGRAETGQLTQTKIMKCSRVFKEKGGSERGLSGVTACMNMQSCTFQLILKPLMIASTGSNI